jgi:hypothetical protein
MEHGSKNDHSLGKTNYCKDIKFQGGNGKY